MHVDYSYVNCKFNPDYVSNNYILSPDQLHTNYWLLQYYNALCLKVIKRFTKHHVLQEAQYNHFGFLSCFQVTLSRLSRRFWGGLWIRVRLWVWRLWIWDNTGDNTINFINNHNNINYNYYNNKCNDNNSGANQLLHSTTIGRNNSLDYSTPYCGGNYWWPRTICFNWSCNFRVNWYTI